MSLFRNFKCCVVLSTMGAIATVGNAAVIRVGLFTGNGQYLTHESMKPAIDAIVSFLGAPTQAGLGSDLVISQETIAVSTYGCSTTNCKPDSSQVMAFIRALDSLEVVMFIHYEGGGNYALAAFDSVQRTKVEDYFREHGVVSIHHTTDGSRWAQWESLHGARFRGHPNNDRLGTIRLDTLAKNDPSWRLLNRGLLDTARFVEEWHFFTTSGEAIRATPGLKVAVNLDESTLEGGLGGQAAMGDHPMSWYREFPEGGRFFYTAMGHRPNLWTGAVNQPQFLRRQIYNAILWAAGADSTGTVTSVADRATKTTQKLSDHIRIHASGSNLTVTILRDGSHEVEIRGLDGRRVALRRGDGRNVEHEFRNLRSGVYVLNMVVGFSQLSRRVVVP